MDIQLKFKNKSIWRLYEIAPVLLLIYYFSTGWLAREHHLMDLNYTLASLLFF